MKKTDITRKLRIWAWFILLSILFGFIVSLLSKSLQIKKYISENLPLEDFQAHMEEMIPSLMEMYQIPGCSIALVHDYKIVWTQGFGYSDVENRNSMTTDTPMSVQSITKSVTAWGVLKLVEDGLIDLDVPLSNYLMSWHFPESVYPLEEVTIRSLLSHTAGMPLGDFNDVYRPGEEMPSLREKLTRDAILTHYPGKEFSYSNVGYHLLELLIEEVTGQSYADYMCSEVLLPLGINKAFFDVDKSIMTYIPTGYNLKGQPEPVHIYPEKASGGLFATSEDIARFVIAGMKENPVLTMQSVAMLYTLESQEIGIYDLVFDGYGLGYYIEKLENGLNSVSHGGQGKGIMTHFQAVPDIGDAIIILTNSQRSWLFISYLLNEWAQWCSLPAVGMRWIIWGHYGLSLVIGMLFSTSLLKILRLIIGLSLNEKKPAKFKFFQLCIALVLLGILVWCGYQDYLIISSVFPNLYIWLGIAMCVLSATLLISAVLPSSILYKGKSNFY